MFEAWSGMPLPVQFLVSFLIILGVIGAIWWTVRRFGSGRLGSSTRGRQPRLAVIDHARVDNRRLLILVRRDNVEHLLMIGGPSDVVVEPNIVRAVSAARDVGRAPAAIEAITRAIPLPETGGGAWPLQPDANGGARPGARPDTQRPDAQRDDLPGHPQPEPAPRQRDTLAALADELSTRMTPPPRGRGTLGEPPRQDQRQDQRPEQRAEPRLEPRRPVPPAAPSAPPPSIAATGGDAAAGGDQSLADMAQRLEAALRKPTGETRAPANPARPSASPDQVARTDPLPPPRNLRGSEQRPAPPEVNKPGQNKTAIYDTLEQEMANLLGRPSKP
jgi:flagellar protein FliO/FliZ